MILITSGGVDHLREEQQSLGLPKKGRTKRKVDHLRQYGFLMTKDEKKLLFDHLLRVWNI